MFRTTRVVEEATPVLREAIAAPGSRDAYNSAFTKSFPGGRLVMTGANSAAALRSTPARYLALIGAHHVPETDEGASNARDSICPGHEFRPVRERKPEQLADHRKGQLSCISLDEIGWASFSEQFAGELVGDRQNARSISRTARRRKASPTIPRNRVWSGRLHVIRERATVFQHTAPRVRQRDAVTHAGRS